MRCSTVITFADSFSSVEHSLVSDTKYGSTLIVLLEFKSFLTNVIPLSGFAGNRDRVTVSPE